MAANGEGPCLWLMNTRLRIDADFYASLPQVGLAIGLCLASGIIAIMSGLPESDFLAWGWRVGFIASIVLVAIGLYVHMRIMETPEFATIKAKGAEAKIPFVVMIKEYPRNILLGMGARYIDGVFFNIFAVFSIAYLTNFVKLPKSTALWAVSSAALTMIVFIPLFGYLSDKIGKARIYAIGAFLLALSVYPAFMAMSSGDPMTIFAAIIIPFGIIYSICYGPEAGLFCDLFDARVRYTGISFVYQFSGIVSSGLTPIIATYLLQANGKQPWLICAYTVFAALVSMVSAIAIERSMKKDRQTAETSIVSAKTGANFLSKGGNHSVIPDAAQRETVRRRSGILNNAAPIRSRVCAASFHAAARTGRGRGRFNLSAS